MIRLWFRPCVYFGSGGFLEAIRHFFAMGSQGIARGWLAFKLTESELALSIVTVAMAIPMFVELIVDTTSFFEL
jgi:heme exporter protein D